MLYEVITRFNQSPELRAALALGVTALYSDVESGQLFIIAPVSYYQTTQGALVAGFDLAKLASRHASRSAQAYLRILHPQGGVAQVSYDANQTFRNNFV